MSEFIVPTVQGRREALERTLEIEDSQHHSGKREELELRCRKSDYTTPFEVAPALNASIR